jgi:glyoxylase-like metal-dependent hydrolase (beta-lactamase superfamily II)
MVGDDGILMIDTQFAQYEKPIRETIAKIAEGAPQYVVNTHWHGDHVGGNLAFGAEGVLVAHEKVRSRMKKGAGERKPAMPKELPVITYTDGLTIHWNDEDVRLVHFPLGHTDGDTVVFFSDSKVVHLGDLMFNGMFPFIDLESGGDVRGYYQTSQSLTAMLGDDIKIIPGHGKLATLKDLQAQAEMLRECIEIMELRIANGLSEEDAVEAGLPQKYASWSWSFIPTEKWLATLYKGLKSKDS